MKTCLIPVLLLLIIVLLDIPFGSCSPDVCQKLKCRADEVCDRKAVECVNKNDMTEGRPCEKHEDCRDDYICYAGECIFFIGRH